MKEGLRQGLSLLNLKHKVKREPKGALACFVYNSSTMKQLRFSLYKNKAKQSKNNCRCGREDDKDASK